MYLSLQNLGNDNILNFHLVKVSEAFSTKLAPSQILHYIFGGIFFFFLRISGPTEMSEKDGSTRDACVESESNKGNNMIDLA